MQNTDRLKFEHRFLIGTVNYNTRWIVAFLILLLGTGMIQSVEAEEDPRVQPAVDRGLQFLRQYDLGYKAATGLVIYTLLAGGDAPDSPAVMRGLDIILEKFSGSETDLKYRPSQYHIYEAAIDVMALEAVDAEGYLDQIQAVADYIIASQLEIGAWYYPGEAINGDTSITQYAILGLWAAHRAGVEIPLEVFEKAAVWHFRTQDKSGGFSYHPRVSSNGIMFQSNPIGTMTAAGAGTLGIIRLILFRDLPSSPTKKTVRNGPRFGVLENQATKQSGQKIRRTPKAIKPQLDGSNQRSRQWLTVSFDGNLVSGHNGHQYYYFYALERTSSVNNWEKYGAHDWYKEGTDFILPKQAKNGSWQKESDRASTYPTDTCFVLLFLMKATKKLIPMRKRPENLGEGVLAGGRGLPDDLSEVNFRNGKLEFKKQDMGDYDQLLAGLANIDLSQTDVEVKAVEKKVDISNPKKLIGNKKLLKSLVKHSDPRVRQVAAWAVGQTDRLDIAGLLIPLLKDDDLGVAIEARLSLCWISRRPNGFNHPVDPLEQFKNLDVVITANTKNKTTADWQNKIHKAWRNWYLNSRPYDARDDFDDPEQARFQK